MPSRIPTLLRPLLGLLTIGFVLSLADTTRGQDDLPGNNMESLEKEYLKTRFLARDLLQGKEPFDPMKKTHTDALDAGAKYMTYRFTWVTIEKEPGKIEAVFSDFDNLHLRSIQRNKTNQAEVAKGYVRAVTVRAKEVIGTRKPIARVNAARVLAKLAEIGNYETAKLGDFGQGELADALVEVFEQEIVRETGDRGGPKRNDGVIYYALRGMRDLLAVPNAPPPAPPVLTPAREKKLAETLLAFVTKPQNYSKDTPKDEVEGYRALRREGIRALVYSRATELKGKDRPGMALLRIMARDGVTPEPRIDERIEAAIGVARMRPEIDGKDYQPEYAAYTIAQFVDAYISYYIQVNMQEQRPFRIYAARLIEAMDAMKTETKNDYVTKVLDEARKALLPMEKGELPKSVELAQWLNNNANKPPKEGLFQGVEESTVKAPNRLLETP